nr:hypothetical protein [uncultured Achromobacter sp.]
MRHLDHTAQALVVMIFKRARGDFLELCPTEYRTGEVALFHNQRFRRTETGIDGAIALQILDVRGAALKVQRAALVDVGRSNLAGKPAQCVASCRISKRATHYRESAFRADRNRASVRQLDNTQATNLAEMRNASQIHAAADRQCGKLVYRHDAACILLEYQFLQRGKGGIHMRHQCAARHVNRRVVQGSEWQLVYISDANHRPMRHRRAQQHRAADRPCRDETSGNRNRLRAARHYPGKFTSGRSAILRGVMRCFLVSRFHTGF